MIEGTAEPVALPPPEAQSPEATPEPKQKHKSNRLMREADTAVGPWERKLELEIAIARNVKLGRPRIVPVLLPGAADAEELPETCRRSS